MRAAAFAFRVLIVDSGVRRRSAVVGRLLRAGAEVGIAADGRQARNRLAGERFDVVLLSRELPGETPLSFLTAVREQWPSLPVVVLSASRSLRAVIDALGAGACDFVVREPASLRDLPRVLAVAVQRCTAARCAGREHCLADLVVPAGGAGGTGCAIRDGIVGRSPAMQAVRALIAKAAPSDASVLILGETGTGKELVARAIHANGPRRDRPFVAQCCSAIAETLLESELFGHVRGAFTGATATRRGLFELADGGTIFLDEVGDMTSGLQGKLLRVLQEGEVRPVGSSGVRRVSVRVISATNQDLRRAMREGRFREDLYYRLRVLEIVVPPLRARREDIPLLARHFLDLYQHHEGKRVRGLSSEALRCLLEHDFPGNVRELENELHRSVIMTRPGALVGVGELSEAVAGRCEGAPASGVDRWLRRGRFKDRLEGIERELLATELELHGGRRAATARDLGLPLRTLMHKLRKHGIGGAVPASPGDPTRYE